MIPPLTTTLDALSAFSEEASPGPWRRETGVAPSEGEHMVWLTNEGGDSLMVNADDAAMIVNALPALIAAARQLTEELDAAYGAKGYEATILPAAQPAPPTEALLRALVEKLELVHSSPEYMAVWVRAASHGQNYQGPTYEAELIEARRYLATDDAVKTAPGYEGWVERVYDPDTDPMTEIDGAGISTIVLHAPLTAERKGDELHIYRQPDAHQHELHLTVDANGSITQIAGGPLEEPISTAPTR